MPDVEEVKCCPDCDEPLEDDNTEPRYECQQCGTTFGKSNSADSESSRCPDCNKFSSRAGETHEGCDADVADAETKYRCADCSEVYDEKEEAEKCECGDEVEDDDAAPAAPQEAGEQDTRFFSFGCPRCKRQYSSARTAASCPCGPAKEAK